MIVLWHPKERIAKCTLAPLREREGVSFKRLGPNDRFDADEHTVLGLKGPVIGPLDGTRPLLLPDATWRRLAYLEARIEGGTARSLPAGLRSAYPRRSKCFEDPERGLASIEALFAALSLMGFRDECLLEDYRWAAEFLERNADLLA